MKLPLDTPFMIGYSLVLIFIIAMLVWLIRDYRQDRVGRKKLKP